MQRILCLIKGLILDNDRKSIIRIIIDLSKSKPGKKYLNYSNYFQSLMYKKNAGDLNKYFDGEKMHKIILLDNKRGKHHILENKINFSKLLSANSVPVAKYLGEIKNGVLDVENFKPVSLQKNKDVNAIIKSLIDKENIIFIKQVDASGGNGIFKYDNKTIVDLTKIDFTKNYIIEKGIIQHSLLNKINATSLNTLRVMTYNEGGVIRIPSCFLRIGRENSFVDNAAAGGVFIHYDLMNNSLGKLAYTHAGSGGLTYKRHPDSNFIFDSAKLPYSEKVQKLVIQAAKLFPELDLIGWDIGYTEDGPVLVEGNSNPSLLMMQITLKGLATNNIYNKIYKDL